MIYGNLKKTKVIKNIFENFIKISIIIQILSTTYDLLILLIIRYKYK